MSNKTSMIDFREHKPRDNELIEMFTPAIDILRDELLSRVLGAFALSEIGIETSDDLGLFGAVTRPGMLCHGPCAKSVT